MDVISDNLANANTTKTASGNPYQRREVVLSEGGQSFGQTLSMLQNGEDPGDALSGGGDATLGGVQVTAIQPDQTPFREEYDPGNPSADARGFVKMPNVSVVSEMVDMISASRAYEADVSAVESAKNMAEKALQIGQA
jgi:flagellar basal-body rod protein FlgC